jgi:hypothetical protein
MMKFIASPLGMALAVVISTKLVVIIWTVLSRRNRGGSSGRIRQPVVDGVTGEDLVQNARRFAEVADQNARRFKRKHHISWVIMTLAMLLVTTLASHLPPIVIQVLSSVAAFAGSANKFFCWQDAWTSARVTSQSLSDVIMDWEQGTFRPDLSETERRNEFAQQVRVILGADRDRFRVTAAKQQIAAK